MTAYEMRISDWSSDVCSSDLWPDDPSIVIVEGLIKIARRLEIMVIAEGIETEVQASQLWSMGCMLGQGFAFARATDRDATAALLRRHAAGIAGVTPLYAGRKGMLREPDAAAPARSSEEQTYELPSLMR